MGAVVRDLVTDAVDDHRVPLRLDLARATERRHLRTDALRRALAVDRFDERAGKGVLAADEKSDDFLSRCSHPPSPSNTASHEPNHPRDEAQQGRLSAAGRPRGAWIRPRLDHRDPWR